MNISFKRPIVLALHYQNEVLHTDGKFSFGVARNEPLRERVVRIGGELLAMARERDWSIVHVRIAYRQDHSDVIQNCRIFRTVVEQGAMKEGSWGAEFLTELAPRREAGEHVITHNRVNAFFNSQLPGLLNELDPSVLIVAGVATNSVVEHTVRHATDMGYVSLVIADACGAASQQLHDAALENLRLVSKIASLDDLINWTGPGLEQTELAHV